VFATQRTLIHTKGGGGGGVGGKRGPDLKKGKKKANVMSYSGKGYVVPY